MKSAILAEIANLVAEEKISVDLGQASIAETATLIRADLEKYGVLASAGLTVKPA